MTSILTFENTEFDVVDIHNVAWLRAMQVAYALEYKNPAQDIHNLYTRNADEFTDEMTQVLDLPTAGGVQSVRVFSPRGCYLLGMLARTEKAKAFRQWVLDVLEGRTQARQSRPITVGQQAQLLRLHDSFLQTLKRETQSGMRAAVYQQLRYVSRLLGMSCPDMAAIGRTVEQPELPGL
jgi:prophage antirepressor-like protein